MKRVTYLAISVGFITLFTLNLCPQESPPVTHPPDGGSKTWIASISIPAIPDAPFSATVRTEWVRTLQDGSILNLKNHRQVARDSNGRTFRNADCLPPMGIRVKPQRGSSSFATPRRMRCTFATVKAAFAIFIASSRPLRRPRGLCRQETVK